MLYNAIRNIVESLNNLLQKIYLRYKIKLCANGRSNAICGIILLCKQNKVIANKIIFNNRSSIVIVEIGLKQCICIYSSVI